MVCFKHRIVNNPHKGYNRDDDDDDDNNNNVKLEFRAMLS
jgi:hypothetical protein